MPNMEDVFKLSTANTKFAFDLYNRTAAETSGNIFISPLSISFALALTFLGARSNTKNQMSDTLHFNEIREEAKIHQSFNKIRQALNIPDQPFKLYMANRLFGEKSYSFLPEYLNKTEQFYGAGMQPVDYVHDASGAASQINRWVADNTAQKITEIIPPGSLDSSTRLVLVNAVYFKGDWKEQFKPNDTQEADFHVSSDETVRVPMMYLSHKRFVHGYNREFDTQAIELPYEGDQLSMVILLPGANSSLQQLEAAMTADDIVNVDRKFHMSSSEVLLWLPKFCLDEKLDELTDMLQAMGMSDAFDGGRADFSGMDGSRSLHFSAVLHRAVVDVNEEGTEAAAATAVLFIGSSNVKPAEFRADRPFLFFIRHTATKSVLFLGRLVSTETSASSATSQHIDITIKCWALILPLVKMLHTLLVYRGGV